MNIIDLTQTLCSDMPVFPGTEKPSLNKVYTVKNNGFDETKIHMFSHNGTHIDAPAHMTEGGNTLDKMSMENFWGKGIVIDCTKLTSKEIQIENIIPYKENLKNVDFALIETGWSQKWGKDDYFVGFPCLSIEAAEWLVNFKLKGIGIDALSIDDINTNTFPIHHRIFKENMIIIENLTNLKQLRGEVFFFQCMPLKYENADGSPVRATAIKDNYFP